MSSKFVCDEPVRSLVCVVCGSGFDHVPSGPGRNPRFCGDECREQGKRNLERRYRADGRYAERIRRQVAKRAYQRTCQVCQIQFTTKWHAAVCCSDACTKARLREARAAQVAAAPKKVLPSCEGCGADFSPHRLSRSRAATAPVQTFCSIECKRAHAPKPAPPPPRRCAGCGGDLPAGARKWCSKGCAPKTVYAPRPPRTISRACTVCAKPFTYVTTTRGLGRTVCGDACLRIRDMAHKKRGEVRRRARTKERLIETVIPQKVFERDGWRCQECRRPTPKKLRGTIAPNAPELDHIVPLAAGGEHSYRNTRCLCRACNAAKSDGPGGQMLLFG